MADYSKLSNEDLINLKQGNYAGISDEGLLLLRSDNTQQAPKSKGKGIDLTPSGLANNISNKVWAAPLSVVEAIKEKKPIGQAYKDVLQQNEDFINNNPGLKRAMQKGDLAVDLQAYTALPEVNALKGAGFGAKLGNAALTGAEQGAVIGGLEGLKNDGLQGLGGGIVSGGALGLGLGGGAPLLVKGGQWLLPRAAASLGGVTTDTVQQAVKPNSRALDLNADEAKALLLDTTSNIRNAYNNLVEKAGNNVQEAVNKLRGNKHRISTKNVLDDINSTFNQYQGENINPARNMTGKLEDNLEELITAGSTETPVYPGATDITEQTISPIDLEKAKQQIGSMINWQDEAARNFKNPILEQIYGKFNTRLSNLSPELRQANEAYANLKGFKNNEGLRSVLRPGDSIDSASQTLKNYKSTVTKGNTGRNIQDLENTLVANGEQPFLNTIDDINAAMDLENSLKTGRNFLGVTDLAKQVLLRPGLKVARAYNRTPLPRALNSIKNVGRRVAIPFIYNAPRLYGDIDYNEKY